MKAYWDGYYWWFWAWTWALTFLFDSQLLERFVSIEWEISSHRLKALFNLKNWETPMEQTKLRMVILELSFLINKFDHWCLKLVHIISWELKIIIFFSLNVFIWVEIKLMLLLQTADPKKVKLWKIRVIHFWETYTNPKILDNFQSQTVGFSGNFWWLSLHRHWHAPVCQI